jgi:hypothetical protein
MTDKIKDQMWTDWVITQDSDHFQERLNAATEDARSVAFQRTRKIEKVPRY